MSQDLYQAFMVMINFAALVVAIIALVKKQQLKKAIQWLGRLLSIQKIMREPFPYHGCQLSRSMPIIPQKMEKTKLR